MLALPDGVPFAVGRARFADELPSGEEQTAKIYIKIEPQAFGHLIVAQLDTGSSWSILHVEVAEAMNLLDGQGEVVLLRTRFGPLTGRLVRTPISIIADEGSSLDIDATVWVSRDWPAGSFIGYGGLLERVRFAVDPGTNQFYFGPI